MRLVAHDGRTWIVDPSAAQLNIGRLPANDAAIDDASMSRNHARIWTRGDDFFVEDLNSRNGTFVNRIKIDEPCRIRDGDRLQFGSVELRFQCTATSTDEAETDIGEGPPERISDELLSRLKAGDEEAANQVIGAYFDRVARAARRRLKQRRLRASDSHDIAASVFESLWKKIDLQQFSEDHLTTSDELWRLLCAMIRFKTEDHVRRENAGKRGGGQVRGESVLAPIEAGDLPGLDGQPDGGMSAAETAALKDHHAQMMKVLGDPKLQEVVTLRLEGFKISEIAVHFAKSDRWVKRRLAEVREIWSNAADGAS